MQHLMPTMFERCHGTWSRLNTCCFFQDAESREDSLKTAAVRKPGIETIKATNTQEKIMPLTIVLGYLIERPRTKGRCRDQFANMPSKSLLSLIFTWLSQLSFIGTAQETMFWNSPCPKHYSIFDVSCYPCCLVNIQRTRVCKNTVDGKISTFFIV